MDDYKFQLFELSQLFPFTFFEPDENTDWETYAVRLDALFKYLLSNDKTKLWAETLINEYSTII